MKKTQKVTVERKERIAFDNHQLHVKGEGVSGILQVSADDFAAAEQGTEITIGPSKKTKEDKPE